MNVKFERSECIRIVVSRTHSEHQIYTKKLNLKKNYFHDDHQR